MHAAIADKKEELAELCRRYDVVRLEVFGSAARGTDFDPETKRRRLSWWNSSPDSDLRPFHRYFDFRDALHRALGRLVDLVENQRIPQPISARGHKQIARDSFMRRDPRVWLADIEQAGASAALSAPAGKNYGRRRGPARTWSVPI